jgi:predicted RNA-binding protein YlxR (DUF448 family)
VVTKGPAPLTTGATPIRTCVGCRERMPAADLLRVIATDGRLLPDPDKRLPGRGASIHPRESCLQAAGRRRAWARALRITGPVDDSAVVAAIVARVY